MKKGVLYTTGAIIILIISFIAFVLPSSLSNRLDESEPIIFGYFDGKKIAYEQNSDFVNFLSQYADMKRQSSQSEDNDQYSIYSSAFNSTVIKYAQEDALKTAGYEVPQDLITYKLKNYFSDSDGKFLKSAYQQAEDSFIQQLTETYQDAALTDRHYYDHFGYESTDLDYTFFGLKECDAENEFLSKFGGEKRAFNIAIFNTTEYSKEKELEYAQNNTDKFTKYNLSILTVNSKKEAKKVLSKLKKGKMSFATAVLDYSEKSYSDSLGVLTNNSQYQIEKALKNPDDLEKIINLQKDEMSPIVETLIGFSIYYCDEEPTAPDLSDEALLSDVVNYISIYEPSIIEDYYKDIANDYIAKARTSSFEDTFADSSFITTYNISEFPLNYGSSKLFDAIDTVTLYSLSNADTNEEFFKQAFSLKLGEYSEPFLLGQDIAVLQFTSSSTTNNDNRNFHQNIHNFDEASTQAVILDNPKLEDNFLPVYFDNFINYN